MRRCRFGVWKSSYLCWGVRGVTCASFVTTVSLNSSRVINVMNTGNPTKALSVVTCRIRGSSAYVQEKYMCGVGSTTNGVIQLVHGLRGGLNNSHVNGVCIKIKNRSLHSVGRTISGILNDNAIARRILGRLSRRYQRCHPSVLSILSVTTPICCLSGRPRARPVNLKYSHVRTRCGLLINHPSLHRTMAAGVTRRVGLSITNIIITPLTLTSLVLARRRGLGKYTLVSFNTNIASIAVCGSNDLTNLCIVPLNDRLVAHSLVSLNVPRGRTRHIGHACNGTV